MESMLAQEFAARRGLTEFLVFSKVLNPSVVKCTTYYTSKTPKHNGFDIIKENQLLCTRSRLKVLHCDIAT